VAGMFSVRESRLCWIRHRLDHRRRENELEVTNERKGALHRMVSISAINDGAKVTVAIYILTTKNRSSSTGELASAPGPSEPA